MSKKDKKKAKGKAVSKRTATLRKMVTSVAPARSHPNDWAVDTHRSKQLSGGGRPGGRP